MKSIPLMMKWFTSFKDSIVYGIFNEVLDLVQFMVNDRKYGEKLVNPINKSFETCVAAYYLDMSGGPPYRFFPRSNEAQGEATARSLLKRSAMAVWKVQRRIYARCSSAYQCTDEFADSISDSIHAVESVARRIDPKSSQSLRLRTKLSRERRFDKASSTQRSVR